VHADTCGALGPGSANILASVQCHDKCPVGFKKWSGFNTPIEFKDTPYRVSDVIALTSTAIVLGLFAAFADRHDVVLKLANTVTDWQRTTDASPFDAMMGAIGENKIGKFDGRNPDLVKAAREKGTYLRIYGKDSKFAYEGYPGMVSTKGDDPKQRAVVLTPACRFPLGKQRSYFSHAAH